jgi:hypothetical protein
MADVAADIVDELTRSHAVDLLADGRVYGGVVPGGVAVPFVWIQRRGVKFDEILGEVELEPRIEFFDVECVSDNGTTVIELSDAVRGTLDGIHGTMGEGSYTWVTVRDASESYVPRNVDAGEHLFVSSLDVEVIRS